jgi:hypothetical protein
MIIIIIKRDIKKVFAELRAIDHEMFLVDYSSSDDEFIIRARIVHLNSMSLNFMLNDQQITINTVITEHERIENVASNVVANNDESINFMNIAAIISEKDFMNISRRINEKDIIAVMKNSIDNIVIVIDAERLKRETLLKRIFDSKDIEEDSNFMKLISSRKKLRLKNLSTKFKKKLENQALKKLRSSREEDDRNVEINERTYHVRMIIKHLHSCARFVFNNFSHILEFTKSSIKSTKSTTNKELIRIFCDIVLDSAENKI